MHIKQVIISGFRSFRNQNEIEPFSPGHNVIVGRNGSGKSNFFDAIQFVLLAPKFFNLRQEDRQQLLHEGAGSSVMAAFVEIVFDNTGDRFSTETDEVVLRRTVGHKKDEFFLNKKRIQKNEVISLLETAGFSRSNPYYIVQQGKVANLCTMKDKDRLTLLKEVSGTSVYEERRSESLKILQESGVQQERINGLLKFIDDRLSELESEKQELTEYDGLDKMHRALEYCIHDQELSKANAQLEDVERSRSEKLSSQNELYTELNDIQQEFQTQEDNFQALKSTIERLAEKRAEKIQQLNTAMAAMSSVSVEYNEYLASNNVNQQEAEQLDARLKEVTKKVELAQKRLAVVGPLHAEKMQLFDTANKEYERGKLRMDQLYNKQGRSKQFRSKKERDVFLKEQIAVLTGQKEQKEALMGQLKKEGTTVMAKHTQESSELVLIQQELSNKQKRKEDLSVSILSNTKQRNSFQDQRKQIWKDQEALVEQLAEVKVSIEKSKQMLNTALPKTISQGLSVVEQIAQELNLEGYYGPVIDILSIKNDMFRTPVEVAAGNSLFHIVVDNDTTASVLMLELEKRKAGRLTFLPLNRLARNEENMNIEYPKHPDVKPLITVALDYDERFDAAIKHVFGRKLLSKDLDTADAFSRKFKFDVITLEGDIVSRKGGFEGGYRDERSSRIAAVFNIREDSVKLAQLLAKEEECKALLEKCEVGTNDILRQLHAEESERGSIQTNYSQLSAELITRQKQCDGLRESQTKIEAEVAHLSEEALNITQQVVLYEQEKVSPLVNTLTDTEADELQLLAAKERDVLQCKETSEVELAAVSGEVEKLTADLNDNLLKRKAELEDQLRQLDASLQGNVDYEGRVDTLRAAVKQEEALIKELQKETGELEEQLRLRKAEVGDLEKALETHRQLEQTASEEIAEISKVQDKLLNKRSMLSFTIQDKQRLLRDLVGVSQKELDTCKAYSEKQLMSKLKDVNERFKVYSNVNRKALDQYVSFNQQREMLVGKKEVIEKDYESIQTLIKSLDTQKEEAIVRTFESVKEHFADVFGELVPGGTGELVLLQGSALNDAGESSSSQGSASSIPAQVAAQDSGPEAFEGVQVRVSFVASGEQYDLQQLSGGQKALVALALIFAIQRSDPAPFYLFDELDQALDANYRAAVAKLIQKQVRSVDAPAQFITTTFRPELVNAAQKCYGIALENKVSNIYPLEKVDAQRFVAALMTEEESVGGVTNVNAYAATAQGGGDGVEGISDKMADQTLAEEEEAQEAESESDNEDDEAGATKKQRKPAASKPQIAGSR